MLGRLYVGMQIDMCGEFDSVISGDLPYSSDQRGRSNMFGFSNGPDDVKSPEGVADSHFSTCQISWKPPDGAAHSRLAGIDLSSYGTPCNLAAEYLLLCVVSAEATRHDAIRGNGEPTRYHVVH
jgi:hypothetical protein